MPLHTIALAVLLVVIVVGLVFAIRGIRRKRAGRLRDLVSREVSQQLANSPDDNG